MTAEAGVAAAFEGERERLVAMAHRVLGSRPDAEDAVQEAWLRLSRQPSGSIDNLAGWLTTVVGRICIDVLRTRTTRPETPWDDDVPELVVTEDDDSPEDRAVLADSVGLALLVVLGSLGPDERLAFVLHDLFAVPFAEIAPMLDRSTDATKMLASRARRKVRGVPRPTGRLQQQREVVDAFLAAARDGDLDGLLQVLDPDVTWRLHTPRGTTISTGPDGIVDAVRRGQRSRHTARRVLVNGEPGILASTEAGRPVGLMACTVVDGRIAGIVSIVDPRRLAELDLPARD
ncbi:sigma-70 family RNA polymerase sigma factor [Nocardioides sp. SYSU D00038]|uniref:sigma-70 family RNA polymerase sigma factor n=1 Tax=Nocardioides sp. SYSU D00038 TaxID=2812554 RepID=UPI0019672E51|nr:sigma-70 family RNA polymerase sigma factor [Nocardioides sp. SYSU D00038]